MKNIISLGAGVQSSTMALMASRGEILPMPDAAIFADTQAEPASVYRWLDWLEKQLPFPVHRVSKGDMTADMLLVRDRKNRMSKYSAQWARSLIPGFIKNPDGTRGIMGRQCTQNYKIAPIEKKMKELADIKRGEKQVKVISWIGISLDEAHRMKPARTRWNQNRWPLIDIRMRRSDCLNWMEVRGYPTPPRSACIYCPFHSNIEWRRLRDEEPEEWKRAVQFEHDLQRVKAQVYNSKGIPYLHSSLLPLEDVDLSVPSDYGQTDLFGNECTGTCGV